MVLGVNQIDQLKAQENEQANKTAVARELQKIQDLQKLQDNKADAKAYEAVQDDAKRLESLRHDEKGYAAKLLKDPGIKVLNNLATDLAKLGLVDFTQQMTGESAKNKINREMERTLEKLAVREDRSDIRNLTKEAVKRGDKKHEQQKEESQKKESTKKLVDSAEVKEAIQDYSGAYAQFAVTASPEAKEKLEDAQERLRKKGFSERDVICLDRAVKRSFNTEFVSEIQDSFIQHMMSRKNTFDFVVTHRRLNESYKQAADAGVVSEVSENKDAAREDIKRIMERGNEEIKDFVRDAVESKLMERHISGMDNRAEVKKLVELGHKAGFNFVHFLKTWEQKKFNLGLFIMEVNNDAAVQRGGLAIGEVSTGGVGEKNGQEMTPEEETELLINRLRAELMKQALTGDPLTAFSFVPKIRKLKNGLIKLGLETDVFSRIEKEAKALARVRTLENLRESFIEHSTYYDLSGPAYGLLKNKIKGVVSNLERLDMKLTREELDEVRDEANRQMHDHTIIELKSALAVLQNGENTAVEKKMPLMVKLIKRLREESQFNHGLGEDVEGLLENCERYMSGVKEHA